MSQNLQNNYSQSAIKSRDAAHYPPEDLETMAMPEGHIMVSTGVIFKLKQPSVFAIARKNRELAATAPKPPVRMIESKGREEEVPDDPDYQTALLQHQFELAEALYDVVVGTGVEVIEIPDGVPTQESEEYSELLEWLELSVPDNKIARFIQWVKYVAAPGPLDFASLLNPLLSLAGTSEEDVGEAIALFRRGKEPTADRISPDQVDSQNGDRPGSRPDPGPSTRL